MEKWEEGRKCNYSGKQQLGGVGFLFPDIRIHARSGAEIEMYTRLDK